MPLYEYQAARLNGKTVKGRKFADSKKDLRTKLETENVFMIDCKEAEAKKGKPIKPKMLADFCRELGMMLGSGVPLIRALNIMVQRDIHPRLRQVYTKLHQDLQRGFMLSDAMAAQPGVFPMLLINMFRAAEASGSMEETCMRMAEHYDKTNKLKGKVKGAMVYPVILVVVTIAVVMLIFLLILPKFFKLFDQMNTPLPGITQFMLNLSNGLQQNWVWVIFWIAAIIIAVKALLAWKRTRIYWDRFILRLPGIGKLMRTIYTARFCRTLCSCYTSGISMINSLQNTKNTVGNLYLESQFDMVIHDVRNGESLSASLAKVRGFDPKLAASVLIGEETGRLDAMLESTADNFDFEADLSVARMTDMLQPIMIVLMALIIGTIMVSVILPLPTMYNAVGQAGGM